MSGPMPPQKPRERAMYSIVSIFVLLASTMCNVARGARAVPEPSPRECLVVPDPAYTGVLARTFYKSHIEAFIEHGNVPMCAGKIHYILSLIDTLAPLTTFTIIVLCTLLLGRALVLWICYAADVCQRRYGHIWIVRVLSTLILKSAAYVIRLTVCCGCTSAPKQKKLS